MARDQRTNSTHGDDDRVNKEDMWCCCIFFYPRCLQRFTSLNLFIFWVCSLLCFSAAALAVFEGLVTTIETRYQLSASEIGLSASMYTVGVVISTVIVTHFGGRSTSSRPVWIALGGVLLALGAFCHTLPQFILPPYQIPGESNSSSGGFGGVCRTDGGDEEGSCEAAERQILQDNNVAFLLIIIGQVILGLGYGPLVPLALAYVDDNASRGTTGLASGLLESMFGLGAIIGFLIANGAVSLWVDFYRVDVSSITLTPKDRGWVGAWWLGLLIVAAAFFTLSLPFFGFPRRIPRRDDDEEEDVKGAQTKVADQEEDTPKSALKDLKEWPRAVWRLLTNGIFLLASLSFITEGALVYSLAAFFPKYMQVEFGLDVSMANLTAGFAFVPPWALGALAGGLFIKKYALTVRGSSIMGCVSALIACCCAVALIFIGCDNPPIAGVTVGYHGHDNPTSLKVPCNSDCLCPDGGAFTPYCGPDGVTFFSPCHAGCEDVSENKTYSNCSCSTNVSLATSSDVTISPTPSMLTSGHCKYNCSNMIVFVVLMVVWALTLSSATSPRIIIIVSSVSPSDKSLALGISRVIMLVLGSIPFPYLYGACIDSACLVWQSLCGERGSCAVYDIERFRMIIYGLTAGLIALQFIAFVVIFLVSFATNGDATNNTKDDAKRGTANGRGADGEEMTPPSLGDGLQNKGYDTEGANRT
ncbi:solute carrier organic anion transporter family member 3A1-like [Asterias amurensis]|uniref:solute carrier organic anion transporter family member 3A1-like n=1 Tax=Asterias amurensis TaxID=7602 RepID=UPI003AB1F3FB